MGKNTSISIGTHFEEFINYEVKSGWSSSSNLGAVGNSDYQDYRNVSGFSGVASGYRAYTGEFKQNNEECYWWSSTEGDPNIFGNYNLRFDNSKMYTFHDNMKYGFSVRCIKD